MTQTQYKNWKQVPEIMRLKLQCAKLTSIELQKKRTINAYSSHVKLKAVVRWKERMARAGITVTDLAKLVKEPTPRISEWLNFTWEPNEDRFNTIESALYKLGV